MNSQIFNVECITSKTNSTVVKIGKLTNKKYRKEEKLFVLNGIKLFSEAYNFGAEIAYIVLNENTDFSQDLINKISILKGKGTHILCVSDAVFSKLTEENAPQGIITVCRYLDIHNFACSKVCLNKCETVVALESVRDPGNMGAILRNAAAFGVDRIVMSSDCADIYSSKVLRATMGAIFKVKIDVSADFENALESIKNSGRRVIATTLGENSMRLGECEINKSDVFVIGNEGHGISENVISLSDETMFIPMCENTESLNAAIASAIIMWEMYCL